MTAHADDILIISNQAETAQHPQFRPEAVYSVWKSDRLVNALFRHAYITDQATTDGGQLLVRVLTRAAEKCGGQLYSIHHYEGTRHAQTG